MRVLDESDRRRILEYVNPLAERGRFTAIRARAVAMVAWASALRLSELCALDLEDVIEDIEASTPRLRSSFYLPARKSKGGYSAGTVYLPKRARWALGAYLRALSERGWISGPPWRGALWRGLQRAHGVGHERLTPRALQREWSEVQRKARVLHPYPFHSLRHTAITSMYLASRDILAARAFARHGSVRTTQAYAHVPDSVIASVVETLG